MQSSRKTKSAKHERERVNQKKKIQIKSKDNFNYTEMPFFFMTKGGLSFNME